MDDLTQKTNTAIKWSVITELVAKFITPVINIILARILAPDDFGVLATITMIVSFAEIFVGAGFCKFLIQHNFDDREQEQRYMSTAFWAILGIAMFIWAIVIAFCEPIATWVGSPGLGFALALSGVTIPVYGIIGIQHCKLNKTLDFKSLFFVRTIASFVPLAVTLPLALCGLGYWSLIIGNIAGVLLRYVLLALFGSFKPSFYFGWKPLKHMFSYGIWSLFDGIAVWATNWIDSFLIAQYMSDYYLGLYKNASSTISSLFAIVTSALTPVMFSALSRLQDQPKEFNKTFLNLQKTLCVFLLPLSVGMFLYRELATAMLFGDQWLEAADIIGVMAVSTALRTVFTSIYSEVYRAKGKFYLPLILQLIDIAVLVPTCMISVRHGFWPLVYARGLVKLDLIIPELIVVWLVCKISPKETLGNIMPGVIATALMVGVNYFLQMMGTGMTWSFISIAICALAYFGILFLFRREREDILMPVVRKLRRREKQ